MKFDLPASRQSGENIVPMINVVFLLLIFFLMTAQIVPPAPMDVTPPLSQSDEPTEAVQSLYIDVSGNVAFDDLTGEQAIAEVIARSGAISIIADQSLDAVDLITLLKRIDPSAERDVRLLTEDASP